MNYDEMADGPELSEAIAVAVFGWKREPNHPDDPSKGTMLVPPHWDPKRNWCAVWDEHGRPDWLPDYSEDIALAFQALDGLPIGGQPSGVRARQGPGDGRLAGGDKGGARVSLTVPRRTPTRTQRPRVRSPPTGQRPRCCMCFNIHRYILTG